MKDIGTALIIIGIVAVIYFQIGFDTSISVDYNKSGYSKPDGFPDRVNNLGLMQDKQNYTIISLAITIFGIILFVKGKKNNSNNDTSTDENEDAEITSIKDNEPLDEVDNIFFCKKCGTENILDRNEILDRKYHCDNCKIENLI